ncbi:MAG: helix-turn-helix transcriptional regulator [Clostridia bacterium]|nr:helix-turn-helix transcriptional regulator [Clostridia bacterium]
MQCDSSGSQTVGVQGWTNCTSYKDQDETRIVLTLCNPEKGISLPFSGYLRFEIPEEGQIDNNVGLCIDIDAEACTINQVLLNNIYEKPILLTMEELRFGRAVQYKHPPVSLFPVSSASIVTPDTSGEDGNLRFCFDHLREDEYLLFYRNVDQGEYFKENVCEIFLPKKYYLPGEAITVSYRNVYDFEQGKNKNATNVMLYRSKDVPGKIQSQEYVILKLDTVCRSSSGMVVFPRDGVRFLNTNATGRYASGEYCMRLLQAYQPLCSERALVITDVMTETWLNMPLSAGMFYMKATNICGNVVFPEASDEQITCIRFTCPSPIVDIFEQSLHYMPYLQKHIGTLKEKRTLCESALNALLNFILHGIYVENVHDMSTKIEKHRAGLNYHQIVSFIEENICGDVSMQALCKQFYCSESYLSHLFKKHMHISIATYIYRAKIAKAKVLLAQNDKRISEIAELLQYSDIYSFSRSFKKITGMSPSAYRRLQQK